MESTFMMFGRFLLNLFIVLCLGGCATAVKDRKPSASPASAESVPMAGAVGHSAEWSEYGVYLNELVGTVQAQWYKILNESRVSPPRATSVTVKFRLNSKGEVEILSVEDHGAGKQGVFSCENAITYPMPYRKWTDPMIAALGHSQELTFSFYYQ